MNALTRTARAAAILAPTALIGVDLADGATRPGYQLTRHWISHLSLGDRGWLGTVKLVAVGLLVVAIAIGLRGQARAAGATPRRATWRSVTLADSRHTAASVDRQPRANGTAGTAARNTGGDNRARRGQMSDSPVTGATPPAESRARPGGYTWRNRECLRAPPPARSE
ncbi:DUF998 domain-containing protein [Micromonospora sp. NPDC000442]|uniref:DUF998 domain-containing protein n=1 Tax=Micromonospora sp. NPDC000442 TaxID=3364217 RepID=UPI0036C6C998